MTPNPFAALIFSAALAGTVVAAPVATPPGTGPTRAEAVRLIAEARRIVTPRGVERLEKVTIGGIPQWLSIRGQDSRNPVLLVLHGGPGWVSLPVAWKATHAWEEYFTVVHWDQRGAGKTYAANDPDAVAPTLTVGRMVADAEEVVDWLRRELGQDRVFVMGHSWGSLLGLRLAQRRPEALHAYIGVAQGVDALESERRGWRWTLDRALADGNHEAVAQLRALAPYAADGAPPVDDLLVQRRWLNHYGGAAYGRRDAGFEAGLMKLAPEYTDRDLETLWIAQDYSIRHLLRAVLAMDLSGDTRFEVPVVLFLGRHDVNLSSELAAEWFARVQAPCKRLVWFENSAHELLLEEQGKALVTLATQVRPLVARGGGACTAGDAAHAGLPRDARPLPGE